MALKLSFIIEAIDRATAPVKRVNAAIGKVTEPVRQVRAHMNALVQESGLPKLGAKIEGIGKSWDGFNGRIRSTIGTLALMGGGAFAAFYPIKAMIGQGSQIHDWAASLGITAQQFQRLSYALQLDGSSAGDAAMSLKFLQQNQIAALTGNEAMRISFARAGIDTNFLVKSLRDPQMLLYKLADGMKKDMPMAMKLSVLHDLLGRASGRLAQTLSRGSEGLKELGKEAEDVGAVMDDKTIDAMNKTGNSMLRAWRALEGLLGVVAGAALPLITDVTGGIVKWAQEHRELVATISGGAVAMLAAIGGIIDKFVGWDNVMVAIAATMAGRLLISLYGLTASIVSFGIALMTTPVGWFLGAVALIALAAYQIYKHWEPIKKFFTDIWDHVVGIIAKIDGMTPEWVKRFTLPGALVHLAAVAVAPAGAAPSALPGAPGAAGAGVGGTIKVEVSDKRVRVTAKKDADTDADFEVNSGLYMGML